MKFFILKILELFDYFHKKKIRQTIISILGKNIDTFFDVGAHRGETIKFIDGFMNVKKIFAFEPLSVNFKFLSKKTKKLSLRKETNFFLFEKALGNEEATKNIKEMRETSSSTFNEINTESKYFKRKKRVLNLGMKNNFYELKNVNVIKGATIIKNNNVKSIDLLKIDTEGYEFAVINGFEEDICRVKVLLFEHHYNLMIKKDYKFSDIHKYLISKNFVLRKKFKMPLRKTFEYIYFNQDFF